MNILLHPCFVITLAVLPWTTVSQSLVPIQFQTSPVLVASGTNAVFTLQTITSTFSIAWIAPGGSTLGQWVGGQAVLNSVPQYQGRVTITATQLTISSTLLSDAGNYTVTVVPTATTGFTTNSLSVALRVFDAVGQVSLFVPSMSIEGGNVSLLCSWTKGTETSVAWGKGGSSLTADTHITINAGSLIISPAKRSDAGQYGCTVSNLISAQTATASLTVYYGPDTPQLTKTSSECVGGGDATVGQTAKLTCTSVSLPPALLSWRYNGNLLTTSQTDGGTLNLQVFSTNQSGQYICTAQNSITLGTSQQQISFSVVVDQRLRNVTGQQKTDLNNRPPVLPVPQNGLDTSAVIGNGDQPDPPLHNLNRLNLPKNQETVASFWHTGQENNETLTQNRLNSTNLNTDTLPNNGIRNSSAHPYNGHQNSNSYPHNGLHNSSLFPQSGQQNPNVLIQTGNGEPGTQTVLINLNPLPHMEPRNTTTQPHMVQVSLNAPQPFPGQPNQNDTQYNEQQNNTLPQHLANASQQNLSNVVVPRSRAHVVENMRNTDQAALNSTLRTQNQVPSGLVQTGYSHPTNQTLTSLNIRATDPSSELRHRRSNDARSRSPDPMSSTSTHLHQMPWDRLRGTPAYPNPQVDSSDSSESQTTALQGRPARSDPQRGRSSQVPRPRSPVDAQIRTVSRTPRRNVQRDAGDSIASPSQMDPNVQRQDVQRNAGAYLHAAHENQAAVPQNPFVQAHGTQNAGASQRASVPQNQTTQVQTAKPPQNANPPNSVPLTQAALQLHTNHTPKPFTNRNQQTQAALQHPGPGSRPVQPSQSQPRPTAETKQTGQRPPTPPPVLRPAEFRTLPQDPLRQPRTLQPAHVMRPHGQRPQNMHRHAMHTSPQRHTGNPHTHGNPNRHGNAPAHRHPPHVSQVHRSRPRL
ncbi:transcription factor mef2A isoform X2 [Colossoma macropomum]|uniref:transcription factor mef2A isoform X2 n=1 Tax=Colossoma macropomum TaxID=42526 RepID=UPI0018647557|nr:transcription factor mef2A isoform X2 [Colossoma macropomum]